MKKTDYKKEMKKLYSGKVDHNIVVGVPKMRFLMIDGKGAPDSAEYADAIQTLYPVAYTLKFMCKGELEKDYGVMPLESLWWADDMSAFVKGEKDKWLWKAMIMQPEFITEEMFEKAVEQVREKKSPKSLDRIKFEFYDEGRAAQVMYLGPYSEEGPTIQKLHEFIEEQGGELNVNNKHHHEIYLGDPRRTDPSRLKTVIRQPF